MEEKFYFLEERKERPNTESCAWHSKPSFLPFILSKETLDTIVLVCIFWYFNFTFFLFTNIFLVTHIIKLMYNIYEYLKTEYFITTEHFVLHKGNRYYYYPIDKLEQKDFLINFNIFDLIFNCKTFTYAYCRLANVPVGVWVSVHRRSTRQSNVWYEKAKFSHVKDYKKVFEYIKDRDRI